MGCSTHVVKHGRRSRLGAAVVRGRKSDECPLLPGTPDIPSLTGNPGRVVCSFAPEPACADRPRRGQHGCDAPQSVQPGSAIRDACRGGSRCDDSVDRRGARCTSGFWDAVQEGGAKTPWVSGERQSNPDTLKRYASLGRALIEAKSQKPIRSPVEAVLPWNELTASVAEAEKLAQPGEFDSLALITKAIRCSVAMPRGSLMLSSSGHPPRVSS